MRVILRMMKNRNSLRLSSGSKSKSRSASKDSKLVCWQRTIIQKTISQRNWRENVLKRGTKIRILGKRAVWVKSKGKGQGILPKVQIRQKISSVGR